MNNYGKHNSKQIGSGFFNLILMILVTIAVLPFVGIKKVTEGESGLEKSLGVVLFVLGIFLYIMFFPQ